MVQRQDRSGEDGMVRQPPQPSHPGPAGVAQTPRGQGGPTPLGRTLPVDRGTGGGGRGCEMAEWEVQWEEGIREVGGG
eukprot:6499288-Pyramimonas_sp.AAC.1